MQVNRIQMQIFKKLSAEKGLEVDAYIKQYSQHFLSVDKERLDQMTEEEGDAWIEKAYIQSFG